MSEKGNKEKEKEKEYAEYSLFLIIIYLFYFIGIFEITNNIFVFLIFPIILLLIEILEELMKIRHKIEAVKNEWINWRWFRIQKGIWRKF